MENNYQEQTKIINLSDNDASKACGGILEAASFSKGDSWSRPTVTIFD